jgi:hypothetical protein
VAGIANLGVVNDAAGTVYGQGGGVKAFTADANYLCSVIVSNYSALDANVYVYVIPQGSTNYTDETKWGQVAYNAEVEGYTVFETIRFGINNTDEIWVAGSAGVRYFVQGIEQA